MPLPTAFQGNFVKEFKREKERKLSRSLVVFFSVCQVLFGFDFGFLRSNGKSKMVCQLATTVAGFVMIVTLILSCTLQPIAYRNFFVYLIQYIPFFIILRAAKYTLSNFLTYSMTIDEQISQGNGNMGAVLWLYATVLFGAKIATSVVYCLLTHSLDIKWIVMNTVIYIPIVALDIIPIANFLIFYQVYTHLKELRMLYEHRAINLNQLQNSYKKISDSFDKIRSNYDAIFVWGFITESSKWMVVIWNHLTLLRYSNSWCLYACSYTWSFFITVQNCVPAVFAEMISVQNDAIKTILHDELLTETDERKIFELTRLLRYVSARALLRPAWRLVPVDLRQPVTMLSICVTYLIVIIQFTHLYD